MFKIAGLVGLTLCTGLTGLLYSMKLRERIILLEDYMEMILSIKSSINYMREPLIMINQRGSKSGSKAFELFDKVRHDIHEKNAEMSQIWAQNAFQIYEGTPLEKEDIDIICYTGTFLGQTDFENQLARFQYLENRLSERIETAKENYACMGPLYRKLGFFSGGLIALIFI